MNDKFSIIRNLVGRVTKEELRYVDSFVSEDIGLFMPAGGACFYALTPLHTHPSYMFVLSFNDETSLRIAGKTILSVPGKIFALRPDIPHQELPSDSPPRYIAIFIKRDLFERQSSFYSVKKDISSSGVSFEQPPQLLPALKRFMIEADSGTEGSSAVLEALGVEVCHILIRGILNRSWPQDRISARIEIDRAVEFIHSNFDKKITIKDLSAAAHISVTHFTRVFKNEIGKTPMEYLNKIRLERAKRLMLAGDKSVTEIAFKCGFSSPSYLSARFRKSYRISPTDYLKGLNKGIILKRDGKKVKD